MKKFTKQILALLFAFVLVVGMAEPAFAAGTVTPTKGTVTVYATSSSGGYVNIDIAAGTKSFTIKRSDVSVTKGTAGASFQSFQKSTNSYSYQYYTGSAWKTSSSSTNYRYNVGVSVSGAGSFKIKYKIGDTSYTITVKVLAYKNPVKSVTLKGVNSGNSFATKTKSSNYATLKLPAKVTSASLKVTPISGWKIRHVQFSDENAGTYRTINNSKGLSSVTLSCGTLYTTHSYNVYMELFNTTNNASVSVHYSIPKK